MSSPIPSFDPDQSPTPTKPRRTHFDLSLTNLDDDNHSHSTRSNSPEPLSTPTLSQSMSNVKKNLSFKSLRELESRQIKEAVWRKGSRDGPGERRNKPDNLEQVFAHAVRGGARSALLAGGIRAGVNLVVLLLRVTKKKGIPAVMIIRAMFGPDTVRFAGMLGIFTFLYKQVLHSLRLFNPGHKGIGFEEWWHSAVAGAMSGLAVWAEKPSRRITLGQQMLVRGLQGQYNVAKSKGLINIKNGDVLLFGAACGQIMYAWLMTPESLPSGYRRWITNASRVAEPSLPVNLSVYRTGTFDPKIARKALDWKTGPTPRNGMLIESFVNNGEKDGNGGNEPFAPCSLVHPWIDTCTWTAVDRWQEVFRWIAPVYAALNLIPPILFKNKKFRKAPVEVLRKAFFGTIRSSSFLACFVTLFQGLVCTQHNLWYALHDKIPTWAINLLLHRYYYWVSGFSTCLALFIEEKKRRGELAMYVLPKALESLWSILRRRSYVPFVPGGEILLSSLGLSLVMSTYHNEPKMLSGLVRSVLFQFVGHG